MRVPEAEQVFVHHGINAEAESLECGEEDMSLQAQDFFQLTRRVCPVKRILCFFAQFDDHFGKLIHEEFVVSEVVLFFAHVRSMPQSFEVERFFFKKITPLGVIGLDGEPGVALDTHPFRGGCGGTVCASFDRRS